MSGKQPDRRTVERVMLAAQQVEVDNDRQAAILGGIVQTLIGTGQMLPVVVAQHASEQMAWAYTVAREIDQMVDEQGYHGPATKPLPDRMFPQVLRGYPTMPEINAMSRKFLEFYDPGNPMAAVPS